MDEGSIRCMGCSKSISLNDALREHWRMCEHCNYFICDFCYTALGISVSPRKGRGLMAGKVIGGLICV